MHLRSHSHAANMIAYYKNDDIEIKHCRGYTYATKPHIHEELSIGIITEGETTLKIAGKPYKFREGEVVIIYPGTSHLCKPKSDHFFEFVMVYLNPEIFKTLGIGVGRLSLSKDRMLEVISMLRDILEEEDAGKRIASLYEMVREMVTETSEQVLLSPTQSIRQIGKFIAQHAEEALSLSSVSDTFDTDQYTIIRNFKKMINTTPGAYKQQIRLTKAKTLLHANLSIVDVTYTMGYYDQSHFVRQFKAVYGIAPSIYRQKLSGG